MIFDALRVQILVSLQQRLHCLRSVLSHHSQDGPRVDLASALPDMRYVLPRR
jgi:hypothetical protein